MTNPDIVSLQSIKKNIRTSNANEDLILTGGKVYIDFTIVKEALEKAELVELPNKPPSIALWIHNIMTSTYTCTCCNTASRRMSPYCPECGCGMVGHVGDDVVCAG